MRFKQFLESKNSKIDAFHKWEEMLHHIAEEELISCTSIRLSFSVSDERATVKFIANCNDAPRDVGYQDDLSEKLAARLKKHKFPGLGPIKVKVYNANDSYLGSQNV